MRVIAMGRANMSIIPMKNVTSITYSNGVVSVTGNLVTDAEGTAARTVTYSSSDYIVRILEN